MKRLLIPFLFLTGVIGYLSCQKENSSSDLSSVKAAKTDGILKGEPVTFSVENISGLTAKWSVTPSTNVLLTSDGNSAKILFRNSGSYSVIASMGNITERIMVNVSDSSYCDSTRRDTCCSCPRDTIPRDTIPGDTCRNCGPRDTTLPLTGDQIHITPMKMDSGAVSGLVIKAITLNTYPCVNNYLSTFVSTTDSSNYTFNYAGVYIPRTCISGQALSQSTKVLSHVQDGYHVFRVVLNNITYTGSFTKTGNHYSFMWPYTSGVTISPLTIN